MSTANRHKSASVHEMPESDLLFDDLALRRELSANLVGFCRFLRHNGLRTGMGEQMDALRALEEVDLKLELPSKWRSAQLWPRVLRSRKYLMSTTIDSGISGKALKI